MQTFKFTDIFTIKNLPLSGRYSLYKDQKAKVGNLLVFAGYPVILYFLISLFVPMTPIFTMHSTAWYMSLVVTFMMLERQVFRGVAIKNIYGMRSVFFACLFPPLLPMRLVWGNVINMVATFRAFLQFVFGNQKKPVQASAAQAPTEAAEATQESENTAEPTKEKKLAWSKTDHTFLPKHVLSRYHRKLGDVFLEKGYVTTEELQHALKMSIKTKTSVGKYLLKQNLISEHQLLTALSNTKNIQYVEQGCLTDLDLTPFADFFDKDTLHALSAVPLLKTYTGYVIAFCDKSPNDAQTTLRSIYNISVNAVFASEETIEQALEQMYSSLSVSAAAECKISDLHTQGAINYEQTILAYNYKNKTGKSGEEILRFMGLLPPVRTVASRNKRWYISGKFSNKIISLLEA